MGIIKKIQEIYERHKLVKAVTTAIGGYALLQSPEAMAAETFFNKPVAVAKAEEQKLDVSGDLTLAGRILEGAPKDSDKEAFQSRVRLNLDYKPDDNFNIGTRLVAEHSSKPAFDHRLQDGKEWFIDRAFLNYRPNSNTELTVGAFGNTFGHWTDCDVPLVGAQIKYSGKDMLSLDNLAVKVAYHMGQPWLDESDSSMWAFGFDGKKELSNKLDLLLSTDYTHWTGLDNKFIRTNTKEGTDYASEFHVLDACVKLVYDTENVPIFKGPITLYGKAMHNFGAEVDNDGAILGVCFGELKEVGDSAFKIEGRYIESDAVFAAYAPKYSANTNFNQLALIGSHKLTDNSTIVGVLGLPQSIDGPEDRKTYVEICYTLKF